MNTRSCPFPTDEEDKGHVLFSMDQVRPVPPVRSRRHVSSPGGTSPSVSSLRGSVPGPVPFTVDR